MLRSIIYMFLFVFVIQCASPQTAILGPVLTGAKTGSIYQASLSYGSGKVLNDLKSAKNLNLKFIKKFSNKNFPLPDIPYTDKDPTIVLAYAVKEIKISEVFEPEPLP